MKLYTAPFCPKCELAEQKLHEKGFEFDTVCDTTLAVSLGIKVAPTLVMDDDRRLGLKEILQLSKGDHLYE